MSAADPNSDPLKSNPPKRKRRWLQFSLRSLLVFTLMCAVGSALVARRMERKRQDRETVKIIIKSGGQALYNYEYDAAGQWDESAEPPGPEWLRSLLGEN